MLLHIQIQTALLIEDEKSIVQFQAGDKSITVTVPVVQELCVRFPFLVGKDAKR